MLGRLPLYRTANNTNPALIYWCHLRNGSLLITAFDLIVKNDLTRGNVKLGGSNFFMLNATVSYVITRVCNDKSWRLPCALGCISAASINYFLN